MVLSRQSGTWLLCTSMLLVSLLPDAQSSAQVATEYQVKAAYVYNFTKFIEWPRDDAAQGNSPLRLCVLDDKQFELTLRDVVNGKSVGPHPVTVMQVHAAGQARNCSILFISSSHSKEAARVVEELKDTSVVTVGEMEGFMEAGGMINFVLDNDRVHFQVNERAAEHAGLHVSSRLLNVAKQVVR
jgi:hypothetical protein